MGAIGHPSQHPWLLRLLILMGLVGVLLSFGVPVLGLGLEDLRMVAHFDHDEFYTYQAWRDVYRNGPLYAGPFDPNHYYPQLFYNLAGLALYPYRQVHLEDFRMVLLVWRGLNLLASVGLVMMAFVLARRVFRSTAVAALTGLLLAVTPDFLWWSTNVRPHPLEQLFTLASLYACIRLCEGFTMRWFWWGACFGAAAFATKYGGAVFLVLLPAVAVFVMAQEAHHATRFQEIIREQARLCRRLIPWVLTGCAAVGTVFVFAVFRHGGDVVALFLDGIRGAVTGNQLASAQALLERKRILVNVLVGFAAVAGTIGLIVLAFLWRWFRAMTTGAEARPGWLVYAGVFVLLAAYTGGLYVAIFILTGPSYLAHPDHLISQVGYMLYHIVLGAEHGAGGAPSLWEILRGIGTQFHMGWVALLLGLCGALYHDLHRQPLSGTERRQRNVLWVFILALATIFFATKVVAIRHLLPAIVLLYAFWADALLRLGRRVTSTLGRVVQAGLVVLIGVLLIGNGIEAFDDHRAKRSKPQDIGIQVGRWLMQHYGPETTIVTDYWPFYVPPTFPHATTTWVALRSRMRQDQREDAVAQFLVQTDPEVLIVTAPRHTRLLVRLEPLLASDPTLGARGYTLVQQFENRSSYGAYDAVLVYERARQG